MNIGNLILPLGITTYFFLALTIISGIRRWKLIYHRTIAIATLLFATIHASIVIILYI